jgi:hypothetical protein
LLAVHFHPDTRSKYVEFARHKINS